MNFRALLSFLLFVLYLNIYGAGDVCVLDLRQSNFADAAAFNDLVVCQQGDTLSLLVASEQLESNAQFTVFLPDGLVYDGGATSSSGIALSLVNSNPITFSLPTFGGSDSLILHIPIAGECGIVPVWETPEPIYINYELTYSGGTYAYTPPLAYNNGIYIPVINILEVSPQNAVAGFGETLVRTIELSQDGLKAFLNSFTVNINYSVGHSPQSLSVYTPEGGPLSLGFSFDSNTQTLSATIDESILAQIGYTNGWLETTTLYIEEVILIEVCDEVPAPSVLSFGWGCGGNSCKTIEVVASIAPPIAEADIVIETNTSLTDQLCGVNVLDLTVSNLSDNALGAALDFMLSMEQLCAAINFNQEFDITSILINGTVLSMPTFSNGKEVLDLAAVGVLTDVDGDDNADDFAIGGSFDLRIEYQQNCFPMSCGAATGDCFDGWQLTADYANFCGEIFEKSYNKILGAKPEQLIATSMIGTPIVIPNESFMLTYCYTFESNSLACSDDGVFLELSINSDEVTPLSVNGGASSIVDNGNGVYEIEGSTNNVSGAPFEECWEITLLYDNGGNCGNQLIDFGLSVVYDCACSGCVQERACDTYQSVVNDACGETCTGINIESMDFQRVSFGWTQAPYVAQNLANASTSGVLLDRAYVCDEVNLQTIATVTADGITDPVFELIFNKNQTNVPFMFNNGVLILNGNIACSSLPNPVETVDDQGNAKWSFDLNSCLSAALQTGDELMFNMNVVTIDNGFVQPYFELIQVRGNFLTNLDDGNCAIGLSDFYVKKPKTETELESIILGNGCEGQYILEATISALGNSGDDFPNEIRPWIGDFDDLLVAVSDELNYVQGSAYIQTQGANTVLVTPGQSGNELDFGAIAFTAPDKIDNGALVTLGFEVAANCETSFDPAVAFSYNYSENWYAQNSSLSCVNQQSGLKVEFVPYVRPEFNLTSDQPIQLGTKSTVSWEVEVCPINNSIATTTWMSIVAGTNEIIVQSIEDITDPNNPISIELQSFGTNVWLETGMITDCRSFKINASFGACSGTQADVRFNWNCFEENAGPFSALDCTGEELNLALFLQPEPAAIQANLIAHSDTIELCENGFFELEFKNVNKGTIYDIVLDVLVPLEGITLLDGSFQLALPINAAYENIPPPQLLGATPTGFLYRYNFSEIYPLLSNGLDPIPSFSDIENRFKLRFEYETVCGFISGDIFRFSTYGYSPCGAQTVGTFQNEDIFIEGAMPPYELISTILTDDVVPCEEPAVFIATVQNTGPIPTTDGDFIRLRLPETIFYLPNTAQAIAPAEWNLGEPMLDTIQGFQELTWMLPSSIPVNQVAQLSFMVDAMDEVNCFVQEFAISTFTNAEVSCSGTNESCEVLINTGSQIVPLEVSKPDLQFLATTAVLASPLCNDEPSELLSLSVEVNNQGDNIPTGTFSYFSVAHDANGNGLFDEGIDEILHNYTYSEPINSGQTIGFETSFSAPAGQTCPLIVLLDGNSNCLCTETIFSFDQVPYENAGEDQTICSGASTQLGCEGVDGYTYLWTPNVGNLSCTDCPNPTVSINNPTNSPQTFSFWLTTTRANSCTSSDPIIITVLPASNANGETINECQGTIVTLDAPTNGSNYMWSPTNGLDNPNVANPNLTVQAGTQLYSLTYMIGECAATQTVEVVGEAIANSNIQIIGEPDLCAGGPINVTLQADPGFETYQWIQEENPNFIANTQQIIVQEEGTYSVVVSNGTSGNCADVPSPAVTISASNFVGPVININGDNTPCSGENVTLFVSGDYTSVEWYLLDESGNPSDTPLSTQNNLIVAVGGNYVVTAYDENGCSATSEAVFINYESTTDFMIAASPVNLCLGESTTIVATQGLSNYSWYQDGELLLSGATAILVSEAGVYQAQASTQNGCIILSNELTIGIFDPSFPVVSIEGNNQVCEGETVVLSLNENYDDIQWTKNGESIFGANSQSLNVVESGTYGVEIIDDNGCNFVGETIDIIVNGIPTIEISATSLEQCDGNIVTLNASNGFGMYQWLLNGESFVSGSMSMLQITEGGVYSAIVTDLNGCEAVSNELSITFYETTEAVLTSPQTVICEGSSVTLSVNEGFAQYNWFVNGVLEQTGSEATFDISSPGNIEVVAIDENGCVSETNLLSIIENSAPVPPISLSGNQTVCNDDIPTLFVVGLYEMYQWYFNEMPIENAIEANFTPNQSGQYFAQVTNANGCIGQTPNLFLTIESNIEASISFNQNDICDGDTSLLSVPADFDVYQWAFNGTIVANETSPILAATESGFYTATVGYSDDCTFTTEAVQINVTELLPPSILLLEGSLQLCEGETSVIAVTTLYDEYQWYKDGALIPFAITNQLMVTEAGMYSVETNTDNCSVFSGTLSFSVIPILQSTISFSQNPPFCEDGGLTLLSSSGFAEYQWMINGQSIYQANGDTYQPQQDGDYFVLLTNEAGCQAFSDTVSVSFEPTPEVDIEVTESNNFCEGGDIVLGATAGFVEYLWLMDGEFLLSTTDSFITIQSSGLVSVFATDDNGCTGISNELLVTTLPLPEPQILVNGATSLCPETTTTLSVTGSYASINWYKDGVLLPTATTNEIIVSQAGNYLVVVDDLDGCSGESESTNIIEVVPPEIALEIAANSNTFCAGETVFLNTVGGPFVQYDWYLNGFILLQSGIDSILTASEAGFYSVVATSVDGCITETEMLEVIYEEAPNLNLLATDLSICLGNTVTMIAQGDGVSFEWAPDNGSLSCTDCLQVVATPTIPTIYSVTITDANGCTATQSVAINVIDVGQNVSISASATNSCDSITLTATDGFDQYTWLLNGFVEVQNGASETLSATSSGDYIVLAYTGNDCEFISNEISLLIEEAPSTPIVQLSSNGVLCEDGEIVVSAFSDNELYNWTITQNGITENPENAFIEIDSLAQLITVSIVNESGCVVSAPPISYTETSNTTPIIFAPETTACFGETIDLAVLGNYESIQWYFNEAPIENAISSNYEATISGIYSVFAEGNDGCSGFSEEVDISIYEETSLNLIPNTVTYCADETPPNISASTGYVQYDWYLFGNVLLQSGSSSFITPTQSGVYSVIATDANGCEKTSTGVVVSANPVPELSVLSPEGTICLGEETQIFGITSSLNTSSWSDGGDNSSMSCTDCPNPIVSPQTTTTYTFSSNNGVGCSISESLTIVVETAPNLPIVAFSLDGGGSEVELCAGETVLLSGQAGLSNYEWYNNGVLLNNNFNLLQATEGGQYYYSTTSENGCLFYSDTIDLDLIEPPMVMLTSDGSFCETNEVTISAVPDVFIGYEFFIDGQSQGGSSNNSIVVSQSGSIMVNALLENGCISTSIPINTNVISFDQPQLMSPLNMIEDDTIIVCGEEDVLLSVAGVYDTYQWFLDGNPIDGATEENYTATMLGVYSVFVSSGNDCEGTSNEVTIVDLSDTFVLTNIPSGSYCTDELPVNLMAPSGFADYHWYRNGLLVSVNNISLDVNISGDYTIIAFNDMGCEVMGEDTVLIEVYPPLILDMDASEFFVCPGDEVLLSTNTTTGITFEWSADVTTTIECTECMQATVFPTETTHYQVMVTDENGCQVTGGITIVVDSQVAPFITASQNEICEGTEEVLLTVINSDFFTYQWYLNGSPITDATEQFLLTSLSGTFVVEAVSFSGCALGADTIVINNTQSTAPIILPQNPSLCTADGSIVLSLNDQSAFVSVNWFNTNSDIPVGTMPTYEATSLGTYYAVLSNTNGCETTTAAVDVSLADFDMTPMVVCVDTCTGMGGSISLDNFDESNTITWTGPNDFTADTPAIQDLTMGTYQAIVVDANGCNTLLEVMLCEGSNSSLEAIDETVMINNTSNLPICVLENDFGENLQLVDVIGSPTVGFLTQTDNCLEYIIDDTFIGVTMVEYVVSDGCLTDTATLTLDIEIIQGEINNPPISMSFKETVNVGLTNVFCYDFMDPEDQETTIISAESSVGDVSIAGNNCLGYVLPANTSYPMDSLSLTLDSVVIDTIVLIVCDDSMPVACSESEVIVCMVNPFINPGLYSDTLYTTICGGDFSGVLTCFDPDDPTAMITDTESFFNCTIEIVEPYCIDYTPIPGLIGVIDTVIVTFCFSDGSCENSLLIVDVQDCSEPPTSPYSDTLYTTICGGDFSGVLTCFEPDDTTSVITDTDSFFDCTIEIIEPYCINYIPLPGLIDIIDTVIVTFCFADGSCENSLLIVDIQDCDEPCDENSLIAVNDFYTIPVNSSANALSITSNDIGDDIGFTGIIGFSLGSLAISGTIIQYVPPTDFVGMDQFQYVINNECGLDTATVELLVGAVNLPPIVDTTALCVAALTTVIYCYEYDDPNGDAVTITAGEALFGSTVLILNDTCISYTPLPSLEDDVILLTVCDDNANPLCDTMVLIAEIGCSSPVANSDYVAIDCQTETVFFNDVLLDNTDELVLDILTNDDSNSFCNETLSLISTGETSLGQLSITDENTLSFIPNGTNGTQVVTYIVCNDCGLCTDGELILTSENCSPAVAGCSDTIVNCVEPLVTSLFCVSFCDFEEDATTNLLSIQTQFNCSIGLIEFPCFNYTSIPGVTGSDLLTVVASNGEGLVDTTYIDVQIGFCSDFDALDDTYTIPYNQATLLPVTDNDFGENVSLVGVTQPESGGVFMMEDNLLIYQPEPGFVGTVFFTYEVCNGDGDCSISGVTVTVAPPCEAFLEQCVDVNGTVEICPQYCVLEGEVSVEQVSGNNAFDFTILENGCFEYTPLLGEIYSEILTVTLCNTESICEEVTVEVNVDCTSPNAINDELTMPDEFDNIVINVIANDESPCGAPFVPGSFTQPENGNIQEIGEGIFLYTPTEGFSGLDGFVYEICSPCGLCDEAAVVIDVIAGPGLLAQNDSVEVEKGVQVNIPVLNNDVLLSATKIDHWTQTDKGQLILFNDVFAFLPNSDFVGTTSFNYTICVNGLCDEATVQINVAERLDTPVENPVDPIEEDCNLVIPNAFSPNDDGVNDFFEVVGGDCYTNSALYIYDRNGVTIYEAEPYKPWNGLLSSDNEAPDNVYFYLFTPDKNNPSDVYKGFISLKR